MTRHLLLGLLVVPLYFTLSCANVAQSVPVSGSGSQGSNNTQFPNQAITAAQLAGSWNGACESDPVGGWSGQETFLFTGNTFIYTAIDYSTVNCSGVPEVTYQVTGTYALTGLNQSVSGATNLIINVSQVLVTPGSPQSATDMNFHLECGETTWAANTAKSISGNNACLGGMGESGAEIIGISGSTLYFGNDQGTALDTSYGYTH